MIWSSSRDIDKNRDLLYCYAANIDNSLPTFRDKHNGPIFKAEEVCPETSIRNCHYSLRNGSDERGSCSEVIKYCSKVPYISIDNARVIYTKKV